MKLSDYRGEDALDILADITDPVMEIMSDKDIANDFRSNNIKGAIKGIIKQHKSSIIEILAVLDGEASDEDAIRDYANKINILTIPARLAELLSDTELMKLFSFAEQTVGTTSSGSATESTEEIEQK